MVNKRTNKVLIEQRTQLPFAQLILRNEWCRLTNLKNKTQATLPVTVNREYSNPIHYSFFFICKSVCITINTQNIKQIHY